MKNKVIVAVMILALGLILFILFAAEPAYKQAVFEPMSVVDIAPIEKTLPQDNSKLYPFVSNTFFGFFNEAGQIVFSKEKREHFSVCDSMWTSYDYQEPSEQVEAAQAKILSPSGDELCSIPANGFVHLRSGRIFVFLPSGNSLCEYDRSGTFLRAYSMPGIITAFSCTKDLLVLGSSDGLITCLDKNGEEKFSFYPGGSAMEIIYGLTVSEDGKYIGCLCGLEQQRFMLVAINDYHKIVFHTFLKNSLRTKATMFFDKRSKYLFSETAQGIVILNCSNLHFTQTKVKGRLCSYVVETVSENFALLTQENDKGHISIFDAECRSVGETDFDCSAASMIQIKNNFYLISDDKLLNFRLNKK